MSTSFAPSISWLLRKGRSDQMRRMVDARREVVRPLARSVARLAASCGEVSGESLAEEESRDRSTVRTVESNPALCNRGCGMQEAVAPQAIPGTWHDVVALLEGMASLFKFANE
jgi:hypothetical protein